LILASAVKRRLSQRWINARSDYRLRLCRCAVQRGIRGIIEVHWGSTVVIAELPEQFAFLESNDPANPAFPEASASYATGVEIPKADWKDYWSFEAQSPTELFAAPDGAGYYRYYVTFSSQLAPKGDIGGGFADYELAADSLGDSSGETPLRNAPRCHI
jgi:hypothetical protein